ncbi:MAG: hypothetical protein ACI8RD_004320, partial [Bacillariaceae sp.]|jgi:hypothetical protein
VIFLSKISRVRWFNAVFTVYWYEVNLRQEVDFLVYVFVDLVFSCVWRVPLSVGVAWESIYSKVPSAESFRRHKSNLTKNESVSIITARESQPSRVL